MNILKNKWVTGGIAGAVLLALVYYVWISASSDESLLTSTAETSPLSQELLITLSQVTEIKLDAGIFTDPVFVSLADFGVTIPLQPAGRRNPFAPVGSIATPVATTTQNR